MARDSKAMHPNSAFFTLPFQLSPLPWVLWTQALCLRRLLHWMWILPSTQDLANPIHIDWEHEYMNIHKNMKLVHLGQYWIFWLKATLYAQAEVCSSSFNWKCQRWNLGLLMQSMWTTTELWHLPTCPTKDTIKLYAEMLCTYCTIIMTGILLVFRITEQLQLLNS